ncbi:hypothetical protein ACHAW6_007726 [Cyclotella cf. meneghiniana]
MIALHANTNAILVRPFPSKHDAHRIAAYQDIHAHLSTANRMPTVHILDNEASAAYKHAITTNGCTFQLVPPNVHCCNAAKRAIHTFKDHFLAALAGTTHSFPADRWDLLLPHAELTLNLLHTSQCNPTITTWDSLFGTFNFDATPLGPVGCCLLIHNKATTHRSWDYCSHNGFYVGPALHHYRCYKVPNKESQAVAITNAIKFRHHYLPTTDLMAEDKIIDMLQQPCLANTTPTVQLQAIYQLREIFHHYASTSPTNETTPPRVHAPTPRVPNFQSHPLVPPTPPTKTIGPQTTDEPSRHIVPTHTRIHPLPTDSHPVASRTQSHLQAPTPSSNAFSGLSFDADDNEDNTPTAVAMPVLDQDTGQSLEHHAKGTSLTHVSSVNSVHRKLTPTTHESPWAGIISITLGIVEPRRAL